MNEDQNNSKENSLASKKPIFFDSGLVYKSNNTSNDKKIEEKSENFPTIMENQTKTLLAYEKKVPLLTHQHERPKSTTTEQKKEAAETHENEQQINLAKPHSIFKEYEEKNKNKLESPTIKIDFKVNNTHKEMKETKERKDITEKKDNMDKNKFESLKERLNFINGQCQDIIYHLNQEQNKSNK